MLLTGGPKRPPVGADIGLVGNGSPRLQSLFEGLLSGFQRILGAIRSVCVLLTGVALVVLTLVFGWLVFGRYVLNATPPGSSSSLSCW